MEILFFAAIAVFIFFKLFEQFGKVDEEQKKEFQKRDSIKSFIKDRANNSQIIKSKTTIVSDDISENKNQIDAKSQKILDELNEDLKVNLIATLNQAKVSVADFTAGSKSAFEMILSAFSVGNLESLKSLISDKILIQFEAEIKDRKSKEETLNTKIISIDNATITNAKMVENFANITVAFTSKQINYIDNTKEEIIVGSKTEINTVNDIWTFKKDCSSLNPNWILITTH